MWTRFFSLFMHPNEFLDSLLIGTNGSFISLKFLSIFVEEKCWQESNPFFVCYRLELIHIDLKFFILFD